MLHANHSHFCLVHHVPARLHSYNCSFTLPFHSQRMMLSYYISALNNWTEVTEIPLMKRKPKLNKKGYFLIQVQYPHLTGHFIGAWIWGSSLAFSNHFWHIICIQEFFRERREVQKRIGNPPRENSLKQTKRRLKKLWHKHSAIETKTCFFHKTQNGLPTYDF